MGGGATNWRIEGTPHHSVRRHEPREIRGTLDSVVQLAEQEDAEARQLASVNA
jgi:hypothetical protein